MLRFHLDESVTVAFVAGLRQRGIDVTTPQDAGLIGAADDEHLEFARRANRVLVTHDSDFLVLHHQNSGHCGVAYCRQRKYSVGELLRLVLLLDACYGPDDMKGRIEFL